MAFVSEMFDQVRDLLNDATDTQVSFVTKKMYLNRGIAQLWPKVGRVSTQSITVTDAERNYNLTTTDGLILSVEKTDDAGDYQRFDDYDILPGDEDATGIFVLTGIFPTVGDTIRVRYLTYIPAISAASYVAAQSETWTGPDRAIHLPVLYAMAMIAMRKIDDRQDTNRYSTTQAQNGVDDQDIMNSAQTWMGQFELELDKMETPLPPSKD